MWELDCEESWAPKNWCFWTVVLEKTLESPLNCKEIQPVHPKGDQSWVFIGRPDVETETPILWPPDSKSWLIWKDPDAGKDWGQEDKQVTDGWMASPAQWTWVWVDSGSWWWTGSPGVLQFMGLQRVGHDWVTELNWTILITRRKKSGINRFLGREDPLEKEMATWVFLLGKSQGQRSLVDYSPWGHKIVGHNWATKQQQSFQRDHVCTFCVFNLPVEHCWADMLHTIPGAAFAPIV